MQLGLPVRGYWINTEPSEEMFPCGISRTRVGRAATVRDPDVLVPELGPRAYEVLHERHAPRVIEVHDRDARGAQPLDLTAKEFDILEYLLRHSGSVVSREMLVRDVWHATARATPLDNVIDVHIARLRRKVDLDRPIKLIHTVRGVGFMLREGEP